MANEIFKCGDALVEAMGEKACEALEPLEAKTEDQGMEKHVPIVEKTKKGVKVKVGSIPHPMEEGHHIEWIEVLTDSWVIRKHLKAGQAPEAEFWVKPEEIRLVREHCNLHGLWKADY